jgi:hypothetical protein
MIFNGKNQAMAGTGQIRAANLAAAQICGRLSGVSSVAALHFAVAALQFPLCPWVAPNRPTVLVFARGAA